MFVLAFLGRLFRWVLWGLFGLLLLLVSIILFVGFIPAGTRLAVSLAQSQINRPDLSVRIGDVSGLLTGHVFVNTIEVADAKGPWISLRNLTLDWSPTALIGFVFEADGISVEKVDLKRLPIMPPKADEPSDQAFSLPVAIKIASVRIDDLAVPASLAAKDFNIAVKGSLLADTASIATDLAVTDEARPGAGISAHLVFDPQANRLEAALKLAEPKGGLIAGLAQLPGLPALSATLDGNGALSDWKGHLTAALDGQSVLALDAQHRLAKSGDRQIMVTGGGTLSGLLPPVLAGYFAGQTDLDVNVGLGHDGAVTISAAKITSESLVLNAKGGFDPAGLSDLTVTMEPKTSGIDIMVPRPDGDISATVTGAKLVAFGPGDNLDISGHVALSTLQMPQGRFSGLDLSLTSAGFDLGTRSGPVTIDLTLADSQLVDANLDRLIAAPLKLHAPLQVSASDIKASGMTLESAAIGGTIDASVILDSLEFQMDAKLFALGSSILPPEFEALEPGKISLRAVAEGELPGTIKVKTLTLGSDLVSLEGEAGLIDKALTANMTGQIHDLSRLNPDAKGELGFTLSAQGPLDGLEIKSTLRSEVVRLAGRTISELALDLNGFASRIAPHGTLKGGGKIDGQPIVADVTVKSADGIMTIPDLALRLGNNQIKGSLQFGKTFLPSGNLDYDLPDIGLLAAIAGQKATGNLKGKAILAATGETLRLDIKAKGDGLAYGNFKIAGPDINVTSEDLLSGKIAGSLKVTTLTSGENRLDNIDLAFLPKGNSTDFTLKGILDGSPLSAIGNVAKIGDQLDLALTSFAASPRKIPLKLAAPVTFAIKDGQVSFANLVIQAAKGKIEASGKAGANLDLSVNLTQLPISLANGFVQGLGAEGTVSGKVSVSGAAANPKVVFTLKADGASINQIRQQGVKPLQIAANGEFANNALKLDAKASNPSGLDVKVNGNVTLAGKQSANLTIAGSLPLAMAGPLLAPQGLSLAGDAKFNATIKGGLLAPDVTGTINGKGLKLVDVRRNLAVNDINTTIKLSGKALVIEAFTGTLSTGGTLTAKGRVGILPGSGFPADIALALKDVTYVQGELATANMAGDLKLVGPLLTAPQLTGKIRLKRASVTIPEKMPASLAAIDVKHRNSSRDVAVQAEKIKPKVTQSSSGTSFGFNLEIIAPAQIFVRGRGLDAELGGTLTLSGDLADPVVSGGFKMKRGRLSILGKRLDFTAGNISFGGGLVPILDLVASSTVNATTVNVTVSGAADDPQIGFSSSPALPEDEVLSLLIFSRSKTSLSAFQIAQLADAAAQLAGGRKTSLFDSLRKGLGVDDLDVTTDDAGNTSVKAGKYINKRTYIEVQQGQQPGTGKAVINLDIGKGVKLQGGASSDGTGTAGILFEKEY